jgi:DNA (cytosine-5)-methyltransferase 1
LYCGPGGIAWAALDSAVGPEDDKWSIGHAWATDIDRDTCDTYKHNICSPGDETVYCEDVRQLEFDKLPKIDALAFGFPCNDFSVVGEHKGMNGSYGPLYSFGVKALNHFEPDWFLAENVGGLRSANGGSALDTILRELSEAGPGYNISPHLYRFEHYGVPQSRHRIVIIGFRRDLEVQFKIPAPTTKDKMVTCREAIETPPIPEDAHNNERTRQSQAVIERLKRIEPGQNAFNSGLTDEHKLNVKGARLSQIYKRLDPARPAYTITGSGGGGTHVYHWDDPRALTNRERARLQTFPDEFEFFGRKESVRRQIGMALPPKGTQLILEAVLKTAAGIPYEPVEQSIPFPKKPAPHTYPMFTNPT